MENEMDNPLMKKQRKKKQKQYTYKDVFDNPAKPLKKITIVKNKKKENSTS
jgi:hypothetical protein